MHHFHNVHNGSGAGVFFVFLIVFLVVVGLAWIWRADDDYKRKAHHLRRLDARIDERINFWLQSHEHELHYEVVEEEVVIVETDE